ncbi:MAG: nucleotide exchange factor GrpE [Alphaproteobacteria bacterium]|nr:MAG: nucleotide exchange factor GrpE [Alphaproteobacteria bacterium]
MSEQDKNDIHDDAGETDVHTDAPEAASGADDLLAKLQAENADLKDRLLRAVAETENVRRRADKDKADASAYAVTAFARDMLAVGDNLRRAMDTLPEAVDDALKGFVDGVGMTERELLNIFERHGIRKVDPAVGDKFDPNLHQAMFEVPTEDHAPGCVMQVVAAGYVIKDRLLRPAMVGVAKGAPQKVDTSA